ncbi:hypothetical protein [Paenibacillus sp. 1P07SE]|uniref:hypothetical protein n=1 Tax=Paenibacillus sp. 1P07SE TaxID=3132209 RepID=UPI0039A59C81
MVGSIRWNIVFAVAGALLTILFSSGVNNLGVTMLRGLYAAFAFFILAFVLRLVLGLIIGPPADSGTDDESEESRGTVLDLATPDDSEDMNRLLRSQLDENGTPTSQHEEQQQDLEPFRPLTPPKLATKQQEPEQLAQALRQLKDQEGQE